MDTHFVLFVRITSILKMKLKSSIPTFHSLKNPQPLIPSTHQYGDGFMTQILLIALGGAIGASLRYLTSLTAIRIFKHSNVITSTVISNGIGCLIGGILLGWFTVTESSSENLSLLLTVGILGSYTTFSAFSLELSQLIEESWQKLITYLFLQLVGAFGLAVAGFFIVLHYIGGVGG